MNVLSILDNSAPRNRCEELGIFKFARMFFPKRFEYEFASVHYDMVMLLFMLLDPKYEYQIERQAYFLVHREAAKTTIGSFLFPMYLIYLKGFSPFVRLYNRQWKGEDTNDFRLLELPPLSEDFILISSKTSRMAENFVTSIRDEITYRSDLAEVFGNKNPRDIELEDNTRQADKMWRKTAFITADNTIITGVGAGQQARGTNIGGTRPVLAIVDDMYDKNNIKTEDGRENVRYWFNSELINSLDSRKGKILWLGTLLHPDTVVKDFNDDWFGISKPLISVEELATVVKECTVGGVFKRPDKAWCKQRELSLKSLSWKSRHDLYSILVRYGKALDNGTLNAFYQEFMNEYLAPETKMIEPTSFMPIPDMIVYRDKADKQIIEFTYEGIKWHGNVNLYIGLDVASSVSDTSDDTVITVAGYARCYPRVDGIDWSSQESTMPQGRIFPVIAHIEGGKYAIHDYQNLPGMCERIYALLQRYSIKQIRMEANGQQQQVAREIRAYLQERRNFTSVWDEFVSTNKEDRILSILLSIVQKNKRFLCVPNKFLERLYFQALTVGMADHDDYPDSLSIAMKEARYPDVSNEIGQRTDSISSNRYKDMRKDIGDDAWLYI